MPNRGFTLLELSIVIVIIGLIVAGISAGQSLVRQAGLRSITSEIEQFRTAINSFKLQYDTIPGDMSNATDYWGGATHDGNGNGAVQWSGEARSFWQHLVFAEMIDGTYPGQVSNTPGSNFPTSNLSGSGYFLNSSGADVNSGFLPSNMNVLFFGGYLSDTFGTYHDASMTAAEAKAINTKMDDGFPYSGNYRVRASTPSVQTCVEGAYSGGANATQVANNEYNLDGAGEICNLAVGLF